MNILNGKNIALTIEEELASFSKILKSKEIQPKLAVILVGENPASKIYVAHKQKACERLGINSVAKKMPAETSEAEILEVVQELNQNSEIHGILCQSPLPDGVNEPKVFQSITPLKDVDCFHPYNMGLLALGKPRFMPCTPYGVIQILKKSNIHLLGKRVVVLGRSNIVGRPLSILLSLKKYNATVQLCHSATEDLKSRCSEADILIAAIGKPEFVNADFVKKGAVLIDVGINRVQKEGKNKIVGDVDFASVKDKVAAITPVPGGVGPMTIGMLLYNCLNAAALQNNLETFNLD